MKRTIACSFLFVIAIMILSACSVSRRDNFSAGSNRNNEQKIEVEAYLFDVKVRRKGKPTSLRLDLYQTDSAVAMFGRAYFNKGAFRGKLAGDSLQIYFPSSNEYLRESIDNLFSSFNCQSDIAGFDILKYFGRLPDSTEISKNLLITKITDQAKKQKYEISAEGCNWQLSLEYVKEDRGWRIKKFSFDDNKSVRIKGSRRIYRGSKKISVNRFEVVIPPESHRITL